MNVEKHAASGLISEDSCSRKIGSAGHSRNNIYIIQDAIFLHPPILPDN